MLNIASLQFTTDEAFRSPWFMCWNNNALRIAIANNAINLTYAAVYLDVDGLKAMNNVHGKLGSSERIRKGIARHSDDIYQTFSGDELIAFVPRDDALGYAQRLIDDMSLHGVKATFVIRYDIGTDIHELIADLETEIDRLKSLGIKGGITIV